MVAARGLPKRYSDPKVGSILYKGANVQWNSGTVTLTTPDDDDFLLVGSGSSTSTFSPNFASAQDSLVSSARLAAGYNGSNNCASQLSLIRRIPGRSWPATLSTNMTGSYHASAVYRCAAVGAFKGELVQSGDYAMWQEYWAQAPGPADEYFPDNPMEEPGGIAIATCYQATGGTGVTGISGDGWVAPGGGVGLLFLAYYLLSTSHIETPPAVRFENTARSTYWNTCWAYMR